MFTQSTRVFVFNLEYSQQIDLGLVDDWLVNVLNIKIENDNVHHSLMESLVKRKLLLIRLLFQSILLPCFDKGSVIEVKQDLKNKSKWIAKVRIVNLDNIPDVCYKLIINFTLKTIYWMMENSKTTQNIEYLFESIQKEIIKKLKGVGGSGKSTMPILEVAHQSNIPFFYLGGGTYQLGCGEKLRLMNRSTGVLDSSIGAQMSTDKMITSNLIKMAGLPAPVNGLAITSKNATDIAHKIGWPIVVKPVDADRGEGVTVGVINDKQLHSAFKHAKQFSKSKRVVVEREVEGVAHRVFVTNGKFIYTIKRLPKSIEGDGKSRVSELIKKANSVLKHELPWLRSETFPDDNEAKKVMKASGYSLSSIPRIGEFIPLRKIQSTASGGSPQDLTNYIHPENIDISLRAAKLFGLEIAGIDIISPDIKKPWHENGAIINEVNFAPQLGISEISKIYIPEYLNQIIDGDGRIPIYAFIGSNEAMESAIKEQNSLIEKGIACFLSSYNVTISSSKKAMILPFQSLYKRCRALMINPKVGAIILVVQTDEFLYSGLPVDGIKNITKTKGSIVSSKNLHKKLPQDRIDSIIDLMD